MAKHAAVEFDRLLDQLFLKRTHWIRSTVRSSPQGRPPTLNRRVITKTIEQLQDLASECLAEDYAWFEFDRLVEERRRWHSTTRKGWGRDAKRKSFSLWFDKTIRFQNCIYIFWSNSTCLYVGRTMRGKGRSQSHFDTHWFSKTTRIDIYSTSWVARCPSWSVWPFIGSTLFITSGERPRGCGLRHVPCVMCTKWSTMS